MMQALHELWPYIAIVFSAMGSYYGSRNAMSERLARIEEKHNALKEAYADDIKDVRADIVELRAAYARTRPRGP